MAKQSLTERLTGWMSGRNGSDELGSAAVAFSLVLLVANLFVGARWISALAFLAALYACWRVSSKDVRARRAENEAFMRRLGPLASRLGGSRQQVDELRQYRHFTCPSCGKRLRVPRGKGKIRVTCPSCQSKFDARS